MPQLYGFDLSLPTNKVRFVANALGVQYDYKRVDLFSGEHQSEEYRKVNPVGKVPTWDDDGFILSESNAIIRYLAEKNGNTFFAGDLKQRAIINQWVDFISFHVGNALVKVFYNRVVVKATGGEPDDNAVKEGLSFLDRFLPVIDKQLAEHRYIVGDELTLADFNNLSLLDPVEVAQIDLSLYNNVVRWRNDLRGRDFYTSCFGEHGTYEKMVLARQKQAR